MFTEMKKEILYSLWKVQSVCHNTFINQNMMKYKSLWKNLKMLGVASVRLVELDFTKKLEPAAG